jgi:hypothetical protein
VHVWRSQHTGDVFWMVDLLSYEEFLKISLGKYYISMPYGKTVVFNALIYTSQNESDKRSAPAWQGTEGEFSARRYHCPFNL